MREILFKAKRIKGGHWVEGHYSKSFMGSHTISLKADGVLITDQIDPSTLCQFTGCYAVGGNATRLFEGDKVAVMWLEIICHPVIVWHENGFMFAWMNDHYPMSKEDLQTLIIKGNIHDD